MTLQKPWTAAEDKIIADGVAAELTWVEIADKLRGRTDAAVRGRFHRLKAAEQKGGAPLLRWTGPRRAQTRPSEQKPWTEAEDQIIADGVAAELTWRQIADKLRGRTRSGVRQRVHRQGLKRDSSAGAAAQEEGAQGEGGRQRRRRRRGCSARGVARTRRCCAWCVRSCPTSSPTSSGLLSRAPWRRPWSRPASRGSSRTRAASAT
ncbi:hypothetical protein EMIHUDRAFT_445334 [Emiliania huxleyi CCMP1516]|uniref:Myb-like domain-containing protein n=2 Tax=Emiliania huxleyi TaxID=2903 RepID=A0A0D3IZP6_EMIH1|nr:hypothetical protein EMIHUDRAFT_445334 [Emiliania huxleyi CCMP1516]EOD16731.1 hypothetical protein EMIHUDRAFT_445334 [Emiliania huxleyi CCMP1516]|eukprot:XP_005769160.1 hypothetical protein EMIHUDRAFT_445334 [Emiliania huxleyi CCMP1516]